MTTNRSERPREYAAVIFDRDGVLADFDYGDATAFFDAILPISLDKLAHYWREWGKRTGFPSSMDEEESFWYGFWHHLGDEFSLKEQAVDRLVQLDYTRFFRPYPDVRPAMLAAREKGLRVGVLSNFSLASLEPSLAAIGIGDLVDVAAAATVIGAAKPDPAAYLAVTKALGVVPQACLFFDDEVPCVAGALALGMDAYRVQRTRASSNLQQRVIADLSVLPLILDLP